MGAKFWCKWWSALDKKQVMATQRMWIKLLIRILFLFCFQLQATNLIMNIGR